MTENRDAVTTRPRWVVVPVLNGWRVWDTTKGEPGPAASSDLDEVERIAEERNNAGQ